MSGDLWVSGFGLVKLEFESLINTVIIPFTRTIDAIFGTNLTEKVLGFKAAILRLCERQYSNRFDEFISEE